MVDVWMDFLKDFQKKYEKKLSFFIRKK